MNEKMNPKLLIDVQKFDITPQGPVSLLGYFNERISTSILDPLFCRMAALRCGTRHLLFIQIDSCLIMAEDAEQIKHSIEGHGTYHQQDVMIFTNHSHTAPALVDFFQAKKEAKYLEWLKEEISTKAKLLDPSEECTVTLSQASYEGLCYNRRWYLKDGSVATNPPKLFPLMVKPEGPVDRQVQTVEFCRKNGTTAALFVNISNHTDTVGGNRISADWTGFMESHINQEKREEFSVFPLIAPQGNINHFDFHSSRDQTSYEEAQHIGKSYAHIVLQSIKNENPIKVHSLESRFDILSLLPREIEESKRTEARKLVKSPVDFQKAQDLTAEDIIKGNAAVEHLFAEELLAFAHRRPERYNVPLQVLKIDKIAFCALPGEPFVEIGLELKKTQGYKAVIPIALANGYFGYIPMKECFSRGGYEIRATLHNCLTKSAADRIVEKFKKMLS